MQKTLKNFVIVDFLCDNLSVKCRIPSAIIVFYFVEIYIVAFGDAIFRNRTLDPE